MTVHFLVISFTSLYFSSSFQRKAKKEKMMKPFDEPNYDDDIISGFVVLNVFSPAGQARISFSMCLYMLHVHILEMNQKCKTSALTLTRIVFRYMFFENGHRV